MTSFASDNTAGAHPAVVEALVAAAGAGHAPAYGADRWSAAAADAVRRALDADGEVLLVATGTGANVLALDVLARPYEGVVCPASAHVLVDECGAPTRFSGLTLLPVETDHGKLAPGQITGRVESAGVGDEHRVQPRAVSLSQATELGTVYTPAELVALVEEAHAHGLLVHLDGARLANAAAALGVAPGVLAAEAGVDVLTLGLTKCGALLAEAVVLLRPGLAEGIPYARKQAMQLVSKGRFLGAQVTALLEDGLWLRLAAHANAMAALLADRLAGVVEPTHPVETNAVFARIDGDATAALERVGALHPWSPGVVRWMTAWDTTPDEVEAFAARVRAALDG